MREEEDKSCTELKTLFYCILIKVHKRPEPAGQKGIDVGGWNAGLCLVVAPVTVVCIQQAGAVLSVMGAKKKAKTCD